MIESWIDLEKFQESRRQKETDDEDEGEEDDDDDSKTIRLNSEESGNEEDDYKVGIRRSKSNKRINFEVNDAMGNDIKSKRGYNEGYDLNTSLTTILSRERPHPNDER